MAPTEASIDALTNIRDLTTLEWYVIPLLAIVFYIYTNEIKKARKTGNWTAIYAGATVFGMDFINETWNGWIFHFTQYSAFWTTPGKSALKVMIGWNIEIIFMFLISGIIYANTISEDKNEKILGIPNRWFWAIGYSIFCVFIECFLNIGGHLVWVYPWWNLSFGGVWLIFLIGYFHFYVAALLVIGMKSKRNKILTICIIYGIAIVMNIIAFGPLQMWY
ncbi:MAG: hypothetical protein ACTSWY_03860 [Promethearchaeota archaeon]